MLETNNALENTKCQLFIVVLLFQKLLGLRKSHINQIYGLVFIPYSVHSATFVEFYSTGKPIFIPSYKLWIKLNGNTEKISNFTLEPMVVGCRVIEHRTANNRWERGSNFHKEFRLYKG